MSDTSIRVTEELADELYSRKERGESYEDVIWRLIEAAERAEKSDESPDLNGEQDTILTDDQEADLREQLPGAESRLDGRVGAIQRMYARLRELGEAEKADLLEVVNVDATGYASAESVWSGTVDGRDTLSSLPGVEAPDEDVSTWRYIPDEE